MTNSIKLALGISLLGVCLAGPAAADPFAYPNLVLSDSPIGYWRLGEASGTTAGDSAAPAQDLTYQNGVTLGQSGISGTFGDTAVDLDGVDDHIREATASGLFTPDEGTLSFWFKPNSASGFQYLASSSNIGSMGASWLVGTNGDKAEFWVLDGDNSTISTDDSFVTGQWNHLAVTWELGGFNHIFLNGVKQTQQSAITDVPDLGHLIFGAVLTSGSPNLEFGGGLDEIAFYDQVLSDSTIGLHYSTGTVPEPGSFLLVVLGLTGMSTCARRRRA